MTIKEVAKLAGVSVSTVSKIVNNKDEGINAQTRSRVLQIVKECNYTPYGMVKNTSPAKTFLLGVLLRDASKAGRLLNGILDTAQKHGYGIVLYDSQDSPEMERKHIAALGGGRVEMCIRDSSRGISICRTTISQASRRGLFFSISSGWIAALAPETTTMLLSPSRLTVIRATPVF